MFMKNRLNLSSFKATFLYKNRQTVRIVLLIKKSCLQKKCKQACKSLFDIHNTYKTSSSKYMRAYSIKQCHGTGVHKAVDVTVFEIDPSWSLLCTVCTCLFDLLWSSIGFVWS